MELHASYRQTDKIILHIIGRRRRNNDFPQFSGRHKAREGRLLPLDHFVQRTGDTDSIEQRLEAG
jgi:hypothetical protein